MVGRTSPLVMLMNVMARPFDLFVHVLLHAPKFAYLFRTYPTRGVKSRRGVKLTM